MVKYLRHTLLSESQTEITARVEALIKILEKKGILTETMVNKKEKEIKQTMINAGKKKTNKTI
ncbi:MAG: hypothetical protein KAS05_00125 [Candidatus Omnitrophica bacterium]|nr:hypothetical protein [Candidatus Omnitrophota bacterium]